METERLLLRRAKQEDFEVIQQMRNSDFVLKYSLMQQASCNQADEFAFCIELKETKTLIGAIYIMDDLLRKQISFFLDEKYIKQGYMSEALNRVIQSLFLDHCMGISARCFKDNTDAITLLKKLGFKKEVSLDNQEGEVLYCLDNKLVNYVYILECRNGNYYTGWTNNLPKRLRQHNQKNGAKYTKAFGPCQLVYYEIYHKKEDAMKREYQIKQLTRKQKEALINEK